MLALVVVALVVLGSGSTYTLNAQFQDASGLVTGDNALIGPAAVGTVSSIGPTSVVASRVRGAAAKAAVIPPASVLNTALGERRPYALTRPASQSTATISP